MKHDPEYRRQIEERIEQETAILSAINQIGKVTEFIASNDFESLEVGLASLVGTSAVGARAILNCQFRHISPKYVTRLSANLDLLKAELGKLDN